jgi:hypothetical protein
MSWNNKEEIRSKYFPKTFSVSNIRYWTLTFLPRSKKSPPSSAEVQDEWSYTSTPLICLHGSVKDLFSFRVKHGAVSGKFSGIASLAPLHHCNVGGELLPLFKKINQPDATVSQVYYLTFMYSSTCFGRLHAHLQELNNCSSSLWFLPLERGGSSAVGRGRTGRPNHDQQHCYHHAPTVKTRGCYCSC